MPMGSKDNLYLSALLDLLKYTMDDRYDNISWWLYEAPDVGYTVWWDKDGEEVGVDLTEPGALYDFLVQNATDTKRGEQHHES